jgi:hypothetical protein
MSKKQTSEAVAELAASSPERAHDVAGLADAIESAKDGKTETKYSGIAIMGSHPATVQQGPFDEDDWLIYACSPHNLVFEAQDGSNPGLRYLPGGKRADGGRFRVDEWFEVHLPLADATRPYGYLRELEKLPIVWMRDQEGLSRIKGARQYPEKEMKERFNPFAFTSSIAFMLAKAIADCQRLNIPRIGIWGVMQASETEYTYQRPGIQYFIWQATQFGIQVIAPEASRLFEPQPENF